MSNYDYKYTIQDMQMNQGTVVKIRILLIGINSGKTQLIKKFKKKQSRQNQFIGAINDYTIHHMKIVGSQVCFQMFNTEILRYRNKLPPLYTLMNSIFCFFFSLSDIDTFTNLKTWFKDINQIRKRKKYFLIGCKCDLEFQVQTEQVLLFAQENGLEYFQTSGWTGEGVNEAMNRILLQSYQFWLQTFNQKPNNIPIKHSQKTSCKLI